ncbi:MAG: hypothetical protein HQ564_08720 [Candidatus Saganbacteria bacterium]|nr:hypothetical protein [Candidatus Saganbacteria bacterium]
MRQVKIVVSCLFLVVCCLGCAKTVTTKTTYGSEMVVEVKLRGNADIINSRYFMVLSSSPAFKVPLPPPNNIADEFLSVGDLPQQGSLESYYTNYYSTWSGFIELNNNGYYISKGPFVYNTTSTQEVLSDFETASSTLNFSFRLEKIFGSSVPDTIYFDLITVDYPLSDFKRTKDLIYSPVPSIQKYSGAETSGSDSSDPSLDADLDIISWKVLIQ